MQKRTSFSFFSLPIAIIIVVMLFLVGCDVINDPETCIPSGDDQDIQSALTEEGSKAVLCKNAVFELHNTILYTADNQEIYTQGYPTDDTRALLKVADKTSQLPFRSEASPMQSSKTSSLTGTAPGTAAAWAR